MYTNVLNIFFQIIKNKKMIKITIIIENNRTILLSLGLNNFFFIKNINILDQRFSKCGSQLTGGSRDHFW